MEQKYTPMILNFFLNLMNTKDVFDNSTSRVLGVRDPKHNPDDRVSIYRLYSIE